jgi:hypothetical protein
VARIQRLILCLGTVVILSWSFPAFAANSYFTYQSDASAACQADLAAHPGLTAPNGYSAPLLCANYNDSQGKYYEIYAKEEHNIYWYTTDSSAAQATAAQCQALRDAPPGDSNYNPPTATETMSLPSICPGGCTFARVASSGTVSVTSTFGSTTSYSGHFAFTGTTCTATLSSPYPQPIPSVVKAPTPICTTYGSGQTFCHQPNGTVCYSSTTGRTICWDPGTTGKKTDGPIAQVRQAGTATPPTPTPPPPGDTFNSNGSPATVTTTTNSSTSTTTTQNYITNYGTNAGTTNDGQDSGTTNTTNGTTGTASGGSCSSAYTCTSTYGVDCAMLEEQRLTRCQATNGSASLAAINTTLSASNATFSVISTDIKSTNTKLDGIKTAIDGLPHSTGSGTDMTATNAKLDTLHTDENGIHSDTTDLKNTLGGTSYSESSRGSDGMPTSGTAAGYGVETEYGASNLDTSGFGAGNTCPTISDQVIMGHTIHFDTSNFCDWMKVGGQLVLIFAALACLRVLGSAT